MFIARVIGEVVSTIEHETLRGRKLLVIERLTEGGEPTGDSQLAVDSVDAGEGDIVLVLDEGGSAGLVTHLDNPPIRTVIVGVVDSIDIEE
ncbi:MAG: EutN/CcmL family microcompartment protein [Candidatus Eisenbacteria bacterium]|nr:EutN/CcmL family microcompartment protein [Candidatus Eisenbacteria bacterium]